MEDCAPPPSRGVTPKIDGSFNRIKIAIIEVHTFTKLEELSALIFLINFEIDECCVQTFLPYFLICKATGMARMLHSMETELPHPFFFYELATLGRFIRRVAMSVCLSVVL